MFDPENCEHNQLPAHGLCGTCGWRWWLTRLEQQYLLAHPWTESIRDEIQRGVAFPGKYGVLDNAAGII